MTAHCSRWHAASGYLVIAFGVAGAAFERGAPAANAPVADVIAFTTTFRRELIAQSLMFALSAGAYLWFYGALRRVIRAVEGGEGPLGSIAFGAGLVSVTLQLILQSCQVATAIAARDPLDPAVMTVAAGLMWALSVVAYVPLAVMLAAVSLGALRHAALPRWIGWLSALAAAAHLLMAFGLAAEGGVLAPGGPLTYALYALLLLWLIAVTTAMVTAGPPSAGRPPPDSATESAAPPRLPAP